MSTYQLLHDVSAKRKAFKLFTNFGSRGYNLMYVRAKKNQETTKLLVRGFGGWDGAFGVEPRVTAGCVLRAKFGFWVFWRLFSKKKTAVWLVFPSCSVAREPGFV